MNILFVDDDKVLGFLFKRAFGDHFNILFAKDTTEAIEILAENEVKVVLSDHHLPGATGIEFLKLVKEKYPKTIRIFVTGSENIEIREQAEKECEISYFVSKPWDEAELMKILKEAEEMSSHN